MVGVARKAIESLYKGRCTITEYGEVEEPGTHISVEGEIEVFKNQPCRLSYSSLPAVGKTQTADSLSQSIKLFVSPDIVIKPGSKITVSQNGREVVYKQSGQPAVYITHQEINLELYKEHP